MPRVLVVLALVLILVSVAYALDQHPAWGLTGLAVLFRRRRTPTTLPDQAEQLAVDKARAKERVNVDAAEARKTEALALPRDEKVRHARELVRRRFGR